MEIPIIALDGDKIRVVLSKRVIEVDTRSEEVRVRLRERQPDGSEVLIELPLSGAGPSLPV